MADLGLGPQISRDLGVIPGAVPEGGSGVAPASSKPLTALDIPASPLSGKATLRPAHKAEATAMTAAHVADRIPNLDNAPKAVLGANIAKGEQAHKVSKPGFWETGFASLVKSVATAFATAVSKFVNVSYKLDSQETAIFDQMCQPNKSPTEIAKEIRSGLNHGDRYPLGELLRGEKFDKVKAYLGPERALQIAGAVIQQEHAAGEGDYAKELSKEILKGDMKLPKMTDKQEAVMKRIIQEISTGGTCNFDKIEVDFRATGQGLQNVDGGGALIAQVFDRAFPVIESLIGADKAKELFPERVARTILATSQGRLDRGVLSGGTSDPKALGDVLIAKFSATSSIDDIMKAILDQKETIEGTISSAKCAQLLKQLEVLKQLEGRRPFEDAPSFDAQKMEGQAQKSDRWKYI